MGEWVSGWYSGVWCLDRHEGVDLATFDLQANLALGGRETPWCGLE